MTILCPHHEKCSILNKNPSWSREYKIRVKDICGTHGYVTCPVYPNLNDQRKATEHSPENLRRLEEHLGFLLGDEGLDFDDDLDSFD